VKAFDSIKITEPVSIRQYVSGGKGGYGYSSSPWHRLVERGLRDDVTACGVALRGKTAIHTGGPTAKDLTTHGICRKCWPV
jgi:hypothetical protein